MVRINIKHIMIAIVLASLAMVPIASWVHWRAKNISLAAKSRELADKYRRLADYHASRIVGYNSDDSGWRVRFYAPDGAPISERRDQIEMWHIRMRYKYEKAAEDPFGSLPPDPTEPDWRLYNDIPPSE